MENSKNLNYISLMDAARLCSYSEPYLRLRARQGKLKSIKIGKKWMTTPEWVQEYIKRSQEWNDKIAAKRVREANIVLSSDSADLPMKNGAASSQIFEVPQIKFISDIAPKDILPVPAPPSHINYANPQFMFVLGSGALVAVLLFAWMSVDIKINNGKNFFLNQAKLSGQSSNIKPGLIVRGDSFEAKMNPDTLEKEFAANKNLAVIKNEEKKQPENGKSLLLFIGKSLSNLYAKIIAQ